MKIFQTSQVSYAPQGFADVNNSIKALSDKLLSGACMKNHAQLIKNGTRCLAFNISPPSFRLFFLYYHL